jgi:hypothetical protein
MEYQKLLMKFQLTHLTERSIWFIFGLWMMNLRLSWLIWDELWWRVLRQWTTVMINLSPVIIRLVGYHKQRRELEAGLLNAPTWLHGHKEIIIWWVISKWGQPLWSSGQSSWLHNGEVLRILWGTNWIYVCYVEKSRLPLWSTSQSSWLHNGEVLCFMWGTNWIYVCYVEESRLPLWSSGQASWL